jgi:ATP-dependent helicase/nuclease subunit A
MAIEPDMDKPVEARLIGTATHLLISELDLNRPLTGTEIKKIRDKLVDGKSLSANVAKHLDTASILGFFESELGQLALDSSNSIWREWPFTFALPISEWKDSFSMQAIRNERRDTIIVQGMIDLLIQTSQGLVIVDFKTDKVSAGQVSKRAELYRRQLALYSKAASAILRSATIARWLYFLSPRCAIKV